MPEMFTCAACGGTFEKERPDTEAALEAGALWPGVPMSEMAVICGSCFNSGIDEAQREHARTGYPKTAAEYESRKKED